MTISEWLDIATNTLSQASISSARLDSLILLQDEFNRDKSWILANPEQPLSSSSLNSLNNHLSRRAKGEPLAYIRGFTDFYGYKIAVNHHVLIPRPETESLVEFCLNSLPPAAHVLEIGTGSGAISIALLNQRNDLKIDASDISTSALEIAKMNAQNLDINFILGDMFDPIKQRYDAIIANLPYVASKDKKRLNTIRFEPQQALFSGPDGLNHYRRFFAQANLFLGKSGYIIIEHDPAQLPALQKLTTLNTKAVSEYVTVFNQ